MWRWRRSLSNRRLSVQGCAVSRFVKAYHMTAGKKCDLTHWKLFCCFNVCTEQQTSSPVCVISMLNMLNMLFVVLLLLVEVT